MLTSDGTVVPRSKGVPQGSVIGPLMMNLFMHYCFDRWMQQKHPYCPFARYCDEVVQKTMVVSNSGKKALLQGRQVSVDLSLPIRRCPESGAQMRNQRQHLGGDAPGMGIGNEDRCRLCFRTDIQQPQFS